jgi:hypothetical protein
VAEGKEHFSKKEQLLAASALMPLLGALAEQCNLRALNYTLFVALYFLLKKFPQGEAQKSRVLLNAEFFMLYLTSSLVSQALALMSSDHLPVHELLLSGFAAAPASAATLVSALSSSAATGIAMAIAWMTALQFFKFSLSQAFLLAAALTPIVDTDLLSRMMAFHPTSAQDLLDSFSRLAEAYLAEGATLGIALVGLTADFEKGKKYNHWSKPVRYGVTALLVTGMNRLALLLFSLHF